MWTFLMGTVLGFVLISAMMLGGLGWMLWKFGKSDAAQVHAALARDAGHKAPSP